MLDRETPQSVIPARVLALELRSLWNDVKREASDPNCGSSMGIVGVLERIARAADEFARHSENERKGIPVPTISQERFHELAKGKWRCDGK
jgi:hypothetical protein